MANEEKEELSSGVPATKTNGIIDRATLEALQFLQATVPQIHTKLRPPAPAAPLVSAANNTDGMLGMLWTGGGGIPQEPAVAITEQTSRGEEAQQQQQQQQQQYDETNPLYWKKICDLDPITGMITTLSLGGIRLHRMRNTTKSSDSTSDSDTPSRNTTSTSIDTTTRSRGSPPFLPNVLMPDAFSAHVTSVSLGNTDIPVQPILTEYLGRCSALRVLYLGANALGDRGIITFVTTVSPRILQQLTVLDLRYNDITAVGITALVTHLLSPTKDDEDKDTANGGGGCLEKLYLEGNNLRDEGAKVLAAAFDSGTATTGRTDTTPKYHPTLHELYLGQNSIGPTGAHSLAEGLRTKHGTRTPIGNLRTLYLEGNAIGDEGAKAFRTVFEELPATASLSSQQRSSKDDNNDDADDHQKERVLQRQLQLQHLYVDNNNIGKEETIKLAQSLQSSTTIDAGCMG